MSENQVLRVPFNSLVRIVANREGSVRYNPSVGSTGKAVLNFTAVMVFGGKDEEDPVWFDVSLWGDIASKYKDSIEHGQLALVQSNLEVSLYEGKMKGKLSANNGYQFVLFPSAVRPTPSETSQSAPVQVESQSVSRSESVPF